MILTVTLNTSVDKLYLMDRIRPETVMRVKEVHNTAGGKGLNVSRVAAKLGEPVTALGFAGGFNGAYLESLMDTPLVRCAFTRVEAETRSCINCWDLSSEKSTEYLEPGAPVTPAETERFLLDFDRELPAADAVAVSGSIPEGVPEDIYCELIRRCRRLGKPVLVDTSGSRLIAAAKEKPTFIKPNEDEILQLTGRSFAGRQEALRALMDLHESGIPCVVLSLGAEGALLVSEEGALQGKPPRIRPRNTVGCGDSMVAGFAVGFARGLSVAESFRMALAVSAAGALSLFTGHFEQADYERLIPEVSVSALRI